MSKKLDLTVAMLNEPKDLKSFMELEPMRDRWIKHYQATQRNPNDAPMRWEQEKAIFLQNASANPSMYDGVSRLSLFNSFLYLCTSGLSQSEGMCGIIVYGKVATFQIFAKGRLQQLSQVPGIKHIHEPMVVWKSEMDAGMFEMQLDPATQKMVITKHYPLFDRPENDVCALVYMVIEMENGNPQLYYMDRRKVISIRDRFSDGYKSYQKHLRDNPSGFWSNGKEIKKSLWTTDEDRMFQKTLIKHVYNTMPNKLGHLKELDDKVRAQNDAAHVSDIDDEVHGDGQGFTDYEDMSNKGTEQQEETF